VATNGSASVGIAVPIFPVSFFHVHFYLLSHIFSTTEISKWPSGVSVCKTGSGDWLPRRKCLISLFEFPADMPLVHRKAAYFKVKNIVKLKMQQETLQNNTVQKSGSSVACTLLRWCFKGLRSEL